MKILQIVQHLHIGGLETMVLELVRNSQFEHNTYILALEGNYSDAVRAYPNLSAMKNKLIFLNKPSGLQPSLAKTIAQICRQYGINMIHSHHIGPLLYGVLAQKYSTSLLHIHTIHDAWFLHTRRYRWLFRLANRLASVVLIADARSVAHSVASLTGINVDQIIHNGIDIKRFSPGDKSAARQALQLPNNKLLIGCAARLTPGKGHDSLIRTLVKLPPSVELVFAGEGELKSTLIELSVELNVDTRIHWLGQLSAMPIFYQAVDSFCLFSKREGLPLSIMEALASHLPIVATNVGGIPEVVGENAGILLAPENVSDLKNSLLDSLRWSLNPSQTKAIKNKIDVRTMAMRYDNLIREW